MKYDVVVVGAGPAGSLTAKHAALNGTKTLLIEKRQEIGSPVRCGEGLAKTLMEEVGILPNKTWIANEVKGARIFSPSGYCLKLTEKMAGNEVGYVIERDLFDQEMTRDAVKNGADLLMKTSAIGLIIEDGKVKGIKAKSFGEKFDIRAEIVVGADGFESQVGRWAGIDTSLKTKDMTSCLQYRMTNISAERDWNDFYLGSIAPGGYIWVFPKSDTEANIGIGVQVAKIKRGEKAIPKKYLEAFISKKPQYAKGKVIEIVAGGVSNCPPLECSVADGIMLVGDSARLIDPLTGGGIANALKSGKIAGEVCGDAVKQQNFTKEFLMKYDKEWRKILEDNLLRNWIAKEKLADLSDEVFDKVIDALQDVEIERITTLDILRAVQKKYPELVKELEELL